MMLSLVDIEFTNIFIPVFIKTKVVHVQAFPEYALSEVEDQEMTDSLLYTRVVIHA